MCGCAFKSSSLHITRALFDMAVFAMCERGKLQSFDSGDEGGYTLDWKYASDGCVPDDAVIAGHLNGETCYVGRTRHRLALDAGYFPGKIQPSRKALVYLYDGEEFRTKNYEVLVNVMSGSSAVQMIWVELCTKASVPSNAIPCGRTSQTLQPVYIGRSTLDYGLNVDKVILDNDVAGSTATCLSIPSVKPVEAGEVNITSKCDEILVCTGGQIIWNPTADMDFETSNLIGKFDKVSNQANGVTTVTANGAPVHYTSRDPAYDAYVMNDRNAFWRARKRIIALLVTLGIELFVAFVITMFTATLKTYPLLISFMPVISAISGNVGLQCSSIVTRALACALTTVGGYKRAILRELKAAWYLATAIGCILAVISGLWQWCFNFGLVVGAAQFLSIMSAALTGSAAPLVGKFIRMDPAAFAGPMETALQDVVGNSCFLFIASIVLQYWPCPGHIIDGNSSLCPTADGTTVDANYCCTKMPSNATTTAAPHTWV